MPATRKRKVAIILGILAAVILLWAPMHHLLFSVRLALCIQKLASGVREENRAVIESRIYRRDGTKDYEALCYRPAKSPATSAVILVAGISELGSRHPMLSPLHVS